MNIPYIYLIWLHVVSYMLKYTWWKWIHMSTSVHLFNMVTAHLLSPSSSVICNVLSDASHKHIQVCSKVYFMCFACFGYVIHRDPWRPLFKAVPFPAHPLLGAGAHGIVRHAWRHPRTSATAPSRQPGSDMFLPKKSHPLWPHFFSEGGCDEFKKGDPFLGQQKPLLSYDVM